MVSCPEKAPGVSVERPGWDAGPGVFVLPESEGPLGATPAGWTPDVGPGLTFAVSMVLEFIVLFNCSEMEPRSRKRDFMALG